MIVFAPFLAYYDVNKPVIIQCDASQSRLGAVLLQEERPVAYSSRVMTQTEQNYAQIEKELLAIAYACEKFDQYIFGRSNVIVHSDQATGNHNQEANPQFAKTPPTHARPPAEL